MRTLLRGMALVAACGLTQLIATACSNPGDPVTEPPAINTTAAIHAEHQHQRNGHVQPHLDGVSRARLLRLGLLAARLHSLPAAQAAGFDTQLSPCVASPEGGMGFHWGNTGRIDGAVRWDEPEVMVFIPSRHAADGVRLGAIEYIVPMALSAEAPKLFGQTFIPGGPDNSLWTLHVWLGAWNPEGLFEPWNPRVSCPT